MLPSFPKLTKVIPLLNVLLIRYFNPRILWLWEWILSLKVLSDGLCVINYSPLRWTVKSINSYYRDTKIQWEPQRQIMLRAVNHDAARSQEHLRCFVIRADFCLNDVKFEVELLDLKNCFVVHQIFSCAWHLETTQKIFLCLLLCFCFKWHYF